MMSDEALNNHLDWLDKCAEEYLWQCPYCGEFVADGESCTCEPEEDDIPL